MSRISHLLAAGLGLGLFFGGAVQAANVIGTGDSASGTVLVDGNGMTLYTFDKDKAAVSNCYDDCATNWPPLAASDTARPQDEFGIVVRADGGRQWTYRGQPLYTWIKDAAPGDITGDGVKGVWHIAKP